MYSSLYIWFTVKTFTNNFLDDDVRWNSTFELLDVFTKIHPAILNAIRGNPAFSSSKKYLLDDSKIKYLEKTLEIFKIFTKGSTIL